MEPLTGYWISSAWNQGLWRYDSRPVAFRTEVRCGNIGHAEIAISACERYSLFLNGGFVACGPARSLERHKSYDVLEVTRLLQPGVNHIAVLVSPPTGAFNHRGRCGLWAMLTADGEAILSTGPGWRCTDARWYAETALLQTCAKTFQEHVDASQEPLDWMTRPLASLDWPEVFLQGPIDWTPPWRHLERRETPNLVYAPLLPTPCWRGHATAKMVSVQDNLALAFQTLAPVQDDTVPAPTRIGDAWVIADARPGELWTFDLGRTRTFLATLDVQGEEGSSLRAELYADIHFNGTPSVMADPRIIGVGGMADSFSPAPGRTRFHHLNWRGGRFLTLRLAGTGACPHLALLLLSVDYPFPDKPRPHFDNPIHARLWDIAADTIRGSTQDVYVDNCWREENLWCFDAVAVARAAWHTFGETCMWRHCLRLLGLAIDQDGVPRCIVPSDCSPIMILDQSMAWVRGVLDYTIATDDHSLAAEMCPQIDAFLTLCAAHVTDEGLFHPPEWAWHWIDWGRVDRRPYSLPVNTMFLAAADAACRLASLPDLETVAARLATTAHALRDRLGRAIWRFYDESTGCLLPHLAPGVAHSRLRSQFIGSLPAFDDEFSYHGNALMLYCGLVPDPVRRSRMATALARNLDAWAEKLPPAERRTRGDFPFSPGWCPIILAPLYQEGHAPTADRVLELLYAPLVADDAPTIGEYFSELAQNGSQGWGACINSLLARLPTLCPPWIDGAR
jgi:hypothetical protein